jgi:pimeloyl-ACP methyl ester carboxylesterase
MAAAEILWNTAAERRGLSRSLVVLVHGWAGGPDALSEVREVIERSLPDADIIEPRFRTGLTANTDVFEVAAVLEAMIESAVEDRDAASSVAGGYEDVVLIGYSLGALLVRKAYVYAAGMREDYPISGLPGGPRPWTARVRRIILLAGMNRGWSLSPRPEQMSLRFWIAGRFMTRLARVLRFGGLIRSIERGAPFVANLRVQWARLYAGDNARNAPRVIQLLGTIDDLVAEADQTDLFSTPGFTYIPLVQTGHANVVELSGSSFASQRARVLGDVLRLIDEEITEKYGPEHRRVAARQESAREEHVVFIMHGIRDYGHWTQAIADEFRRLAPDIATRTARYRYFPMGAFLLLGQREKFVRWFMDLYTEEVARNPDVRVSFVGHSNGTYILARAMEIYPVLNVQHVVFAGSVVRRDYPWSRWKDAGRLEAVRNYRAARDFVVAVFPRLFELLRETTPLPLRNDIGSGGFLGFQDPVGNAHEITVRGGHGGALDPRNHAAIIRFVAAGESIAVPGLVVEELDQGIVLASKLCWVIWSILLAVVVLGGMLLGWLVPPGMALGVVGVYVVIVLFALQTA